MSFPPDDLPSFYSFNEWANARVLETLRALPEADYVKEQGGGWPSLQSRLRPPRGRHGRLGRALLRPGRDAPRDRRRASRPRGRGARPPRGAGEARTLLATYTPERLAGPFIWKNLKGEEKTAPFWVVVRHVVNHQTYHRGQISSMVRRLGHAPKSTDMVVWGIEQAARP